MVLTVGETDCEPESGWVPVHCPDVGYADAIQVVAFVVDHVSVEDWPEETDVGEVFSETVGAVAAS